MGGQSVSLTVTDNDGAEHTVSSSIKVLPVGDMDTDGDVDKVDLQQFVMAIRRGLDIDKSFDLNKDGRIDNRDVRLFRSICSYLKLKHQKLICNTQMYLG